MAIDCFLKIETIPGESTDDQHKDWIEILVITSYSIHYTKLYEGKIVADAAAAGTPANPDTVRLHDMLKTADRITSYNVCYTKLLRGRLSTRLL